MLLKRLSGGQQMDGPVPVVSGADKGSARRCRVCQAEVGMPHSAPPQYIMARELDP